MLIFFVAVFTKYVRMGVLYVEIRVVSVLLVGRSTSIDLRSALISSWVTTALIGVFELSC